MDANTQLANDVHFVTAPFQFIWRSILWLLFLLFAPLIFLTVPFILIATDPNADFGMISAELRRVFPLRRKRRKRH